MAAVVAAAPVAVLDAVGENGEGVVAEQVGHALGAEHLRPRLAADVAVGHGMLLHVALVQAGHNQPGELRRPHAGQVGQQQAQPDVKPHSGIAHDDPPPGTVFYFTASSGKKQGRR